MRKLIFAALCILAPAITAAAQQAGGKAAMQATQQQDSTTYRGYFYNKEYNIYIQLDAYRASITVPGQAIYGELNGYLGDTRDSRKWLFTSAEVDKRKGAVLEIVNDYGSEDLMATLTLKDDGSYLLTQEQGSTMKIARNRKWQKLPKTIVFVKRGSDYEAKMNKK